MNPILQLQEDLLLLGYNPGPLDGIRGRKTNAAIVAYCQAHQLDPNLPGLFDIIHRAAEEKRGAATEEGRALFFDEAGLLQASPESPFIVFHAPTPERGVRSEAVIEWMVWHYTACKAPNLSAKHTGLLDHYMSAANYTPAQKEMLRAELAGRPLPSALLLCLAGAAEKKRESSWDFCIGDGPLAEFGGKLPIVQCNPDLTKRYTWHAGQPFKEYQAKSPKKPIKNSDGRIVWDGYKFVYPGGVKVNKISVGIECELYGQVKKKDERFFAGDLDVTERLPGGTIEIEGKLYEKPHALADRARSELAACLTEEFHIGADRIEQHRSFDPLRRVDVWPPIDLKQI